MALASAITSASSVKRNSGASGPKVSSRATRASCGTSTSTVGAKKLPPSAWPPASSRAPLASASSRWLCTLATAAGLISGPVVTPGSAPLPTLSLATAAASFSAKAS